MARLEVAAFTQVNSENKGQKSGAERIEKCLTLVRKRGNSTVQVSEAWLLKRLASWPAGVVYSYNPSFSRNGGGESQSNACPGENMRPYLKNKPKARQKV
jgi:hypothetical protein